jgi:hypothetical protein
VPWLRRLVADLSPRRLGFGLRPVDIRFVVDKVALGQGFFSTSVFPYQRHSIHTPHPSPSAGCAYQDKRSEACQPSKKCWFGNRRTLGGKVVSLSFCIAKLIAVCSEIHTKPINTLCGQNVEFVNAKPGGAYSNYWRAVYTAYRNHGLEGGLFSRIFNTEYLYVT